MGADKTWAAKSGWWVLAQNGATRIRPVVVKWREIGEASGEPVVWPEVTCGDEVNVGSSLRIGVSWLCEARGESVGVSCACRGEHRPVG